MGVGAGEGQSCNDSLPSFPSVGHSSDAGAGGSVHVALSMDGFLSSRKSRGLSRAAGQTAFQIRSIFQTPKLNAKHISLVF